MARAISANRPLTSVISVPLCFYLFGLRSTALLSLLYSLTRSVRLLASIVFAGHLGGGVFPAATPLTAGNLDHSATEYLFAASQ